ncbi:MAG: class I SAM-dependent methyltransferase [Bacteroidota bacterium]|nr:class I SAM-dependent methyltransferase [Bacteroidota bacterium]
MANRLKDLDPTGRFSNRVAHYAKYRPSYPPELIAFLEQWRPGAGRAGQVADIGSGTGILTELLLLKGLYVIGVEPNAEMRGEAERRLAGYERFFSQAGRAEATGLEDQSVDLITVAQAFHWMDPTASRAEFLRILRPGGHIALIWNLRLPDSPFLQGYEKLVLEFGKNYEAANRIDEPAIAAFFSGLRQKVTAFPNEQLLDFETLKGRVLSASYMPLEKDAGYDDMIRRLEDLFARFNENGLVKMDYETKVYYNE